MEAVGKIAIFLLVAIGVALVIFRVFPRLPFSKRLILEKKLGAEEGYETTPEKDRQWLGKKGTAASDLRPAGIANVNGQRVDVVSEGEFIQAGQAIEVVYVDGNRVVVRQVTKTMERGET